MRDKQLRFGENGDLEEPDPEKDKEQRLGDDGKPLGSHLTKGRFNQYEIRSLAMKSVRRSDREKAMFSIYELTLSGWDPWPLLEQIMLEDCRLSVEEAYIPAAIHRLKELAHDRWNLHEGMGLAAAMRAASILAEADSSHELLFIKNHWNDVTKERLTALKNGEEPEMDFPVEPDLSDVEYVVLDTHTYSGSAKGRDFDHYLYEAARTTEMTELGKYARRKRMEYRQDEYDFTEEQYEHACTPVEEDDPWPGERDFRNQSLDDLE